MVYVELFIITDQSDLEILATAVIANSSSNTEIKLEKSDDELRPYSGIANIGDLDIKCFVGPVGEALFKKQIKGEIELEQYIKDEINRHTKGYTQKIDFEPNSYVCFCKEFIDMVKVSKSVVDLAKKICSDLSNNGDNARLYISLQAPAARHAFLPYLK